MNSSDRAATLPTPVQKPGCNFTFLQHLAEKELREQSANPIGSFFWCGKNRLEKPIYAGGRWRMIDRVPWWDGSTDQIPVITGHY